MKKILKTALILFIGLFVRQGVDSRSDLVLQSGGTIPVIITAPHGGGEKIPGIPERTKGNKYRDVNTCRIARIIQKELAASLPGSPYIVLAEFNRKYIDANRPEDRGVESPEAKRYYRNYHNAIKKYINEIRKKWGSGLLVDIHGQSLEPGTIHRGTRNGKTFTSAIEKHGIACLTGPAAIFGVLEKLGYRVYPSAMKKEGVLQERKIFSGGYTVNTYGSHRKEGIDAIQIEIGRIHRLGKNNYEKCARDIARAITVYYDTCIKSVKK